MSTATRMSIRTAIWTTLALVAALPVLVASAGLDGTRWPWLATVVAVASAITRIVNTPAIDGLLTQVGLGRTAAPDGAHEAGAPVDAPVDVPADPAADTLP